MRLVNDDRDLILNKVVDATFRDRQAEFVAAEEALSVRIRDSQMTPAQIKAVDSLPRNYFGHFNSYDHLDVKFGDEEGSSNMLRFHPGDDLRVPLAIRRGVLLIEDQALWDEMVAHKDAWKALTEERDFYAKQTKGVLAAFTTVEKLVEHWPTLKDVMGPAFFEARAPKPVTLPTTIINALDDQLRAKRPFPAEVAAAA